MAVKVMGEIGLDLSAARPKPVDRYLDQTFDYVVTVCDNAREACPVFTGRVRHRLHIGFDDPAEAVGTEARILEEFRRVRDEIRSGFTALYRQSINPGPGRGAGEFRT
jgi:arsenate reductase